MQRLKIHIGFAHNAQPGPGTQRLRQAGERLYGGIHPLVRLDLAEQHKGQFTLHGILGRIVPGAVNGTMRKNHQSILRYALGDETLTTLHRVHDQPIEACEAVKKTMRLQPR